MMEEEVNHYRNVFRKDRPPSKNCGAPARADVRLLMACLGILFILLVARIIDIVYISTLINEQKANLSSLMAKNQMLENKTEELIRDRDDLNWTLGVILKFSNFPVNDSCPDMKCQPCVNGWTLFQNKCYLFYKENYHWKTWYQSRSYCQDRAADLVVIDDLREQEFIGNHTQYYYDMYHGYWIGLKKTGQSWLWVDGRNDTLGYWIQGQYGAEGRYTLMIPDKNLTESWDQSHYAFLNRFICEGEVLIRSR